MKFPTHGLGGIWLDTKGRRIRVENDTTVLFVGREEATGYLVIYDAEGTAFSEPDGTWNLVELDRKATLELGLATKLEYDKLPLSIEYKISEDIVVVNGVPITGDFFRALVTPIMPLLVPCLGNAPGAVYWRTIRTADGKISVEKVTNETCP